MKKILYKKLKDKNLTQLHEFKVGSWVSIVDPDTHELEKIAKEFQLDTGHLKDALDPNEVPRYETENSDVYLFTRVPVKKDQTISTNPLLVIMRSTCVLTITNQNFPLEKLMTEKNIDFSTTQKVKLFIQFFTIVNNIYTQMITNVNRESHKAVANIDKIQNRDIIKMVEYERILNEFLNAVIQNNSMLNNILKGKSLTLFPQDRDLIEDLFLTTGQLIELSKSSMMNIRNIRDSYTTIMTNNLNRVIKFFTSLTIILTIPTIVSSFYGMNISLPFMQHPAAFGLIFTGTLIICSILLYIFQRKDWL
ncbi:magnesium transporter CorA family protein [Patescibacteria group bacterium]